jgi:formyltetrahydrofolate deformylase
MSVHREGKPHYILTVTCDSRMGLMARISEFLYLRDCYITDMQQFEDLSSGRYFARVSFFGEPGVTPDIESLRNDFEVVGELEQMEWSIVDADRKQRVLIMVSKFDHCLVDLLYRSRTGELKIDVTVVVSNHPDLRGLVEAQGLRFVHIPVTHETKLAQEDKLMELVHETRSELVVLARYMQLLSDELCRRLRGQAINIHHSFLPGFKGDKLYHQAHARGVKLTGATAHYVTTQLDEGPIIEQVVQRVDHAYTAEMLASTGRDSECNALATAVRLHLERRVFLNDSKTVIFS